MLSVVGSQECPHTCTPRCRRVAPIAGMGRTLAVARGHPRPADLPPLLLCEPGPEALEVRANCPTSTPATAPQCYSICGACSATRFRTYARAAATASSNCFRDSSGGTLMVNDWSTSSPNRASTSRDVCHSSSAEPRLMVSSLILNMLPKLCHPFPADLPPLSLRRPGPGPARVPAATRRHGNWARRVQFQQRIATKRVPPGLTVAVFSASFTQGRSCAMAARRRRPTNSHCDEIPRAWPYAPLDARS